MVPQGKSKDAGVQRKDHNFSVNLTQIIAALITASGVVVAAYFTGSAVGSHPTPTVTVTVTKAAGNSSPTPSTSSSIYWKGGVIFAEDGSNLNFDLNPANRDSVGIGYGGNTLSASNNALLAPWTGPGTPSASQCREWIPTHSSADVAFPAGGMQICIKTDQGRYGLLHIQSSANNQLAATAVIWNL